MQGTISSKLTIVNKFFTPIWGILIFTFFLKDNFNRNFLYDPTVVIILLFAFALFIYFAWYSWQLKKVTILSSSLLVSDYFREVKIPLYEIDYITESFWNNIHPVTIYLKTESEFGNKIIFMPTYRFFDFWTSHPIVRELNTLASKHKKSSMLGIN